MAKTTHLKGQIGRPRSKLFSRAFWWKMFPKLLQKSQEQWQTVEQAQVHTYITSMLQSPTQNQIKKYDLSLRVSYSR